MENIFKFDLARMNLKDIILHMGDYNKVTFVVFKIRLENLLTKQN